MIEIAANPKRVSAQIGGDAGHVAPDVCAEFVILQQQATFLRAENNVVKELLVRRHDKRALPEGLKAANGASHWARESFYKARRASQAMCRPPGFGLVGDTIRWLTPPAAHVSASGLWAIIGGSCHRMFVFGPPACVGANQDRQLRFKPAAGTSLPVASAIGKQTQDFSSPEGDTSPHSPNMCRPPGFQHSKASIRWLTPPAAHVSAFGPSSVADAGASHRWLSSQ